MKPVFQTIYSVPHGNCLQACVASILELSLEEVPNFMLHGDGWWQYYVEWMISNYNLQPISIVIEKGCTVPHGYHFIQGKSPRGDYDHIVVAFNGNEIHDPFPDSIPLLSQDLYEIFHCVNIGS